MHHKIQYSYIAREKYLILSNKEGCVKEKPMASQDIILLLWEWMEKALLDVTKCLLTYTIFMSTAPFKASVSCRT